MKPSDASNVLAYIESVFPKWSITDELRGLWVEKLGHLDHHPGQVIHAVKQHRMDTKFNDPKWVEIRGILSNIPTPGEAAKKVVAEHGETEDQFRAKRDRTRSVVAQMDPVDIAALSERAAARLEKAGHRHYADRIRNPRSDDDGLGGCLIAAMERQLEIEKPGVFTGVASGGR